MFMHLKKKKHFWTDQKIDYDSWKIEKNLL